VADTLPAVGRRRSARIGGVTFAFDERVLEPRPWTAGQSAWAADLLGDLPAGPVLELCCGAGHIGLLAVYDHDRQLVQVDIDPTACAYARHNAGEAGLAERVEVRCAPMHEGVLPAERFPLVIADPPWVASRDLGRYPDDPPLAIDGGPHGLDVALDCLDVARRALAPRGACLIQLGTLGQVEELAAYAGERPHWDLVVTEHRVFERGVVARLDRA
jgi:release factor glutamine methyltransferase